MFKYSMLIYFFFINYPATLCVKIISLKITIFIKVCVVILIIRVSNYLKFFTRQSTAHTIKADVIILYVTRMLLVCFVTYLLYVICMFCMFVCAKVY